MTQDLPTWLICLRTTPPPLVVASPSGLSGPKYATFAPQFSHPAQTSDLPPVPLYKLIRGSFALIHTPGKLLSAENPLATVFFPSFPKVHEVLGTKEANFFLRME